MDLGKRIASQLEAATFERIAGVGLENAAVNRPKMRAAVATSAAPAVVARCEAAGIAMYWWNPMYDDYDKPDSVSRRLHRTNGLPCLNGGGNVGTAAWVITHAVLGKRRIGLVGIDFGYPPGTPYERTQYYPELREMFGDRYAEAFITVEDRKSVV